MTPRIPIPHAAIADFCRKWKITELALFGSVLREDFGPSSDVDVLVTFAPDTSHTLLSLSQMQTELSKLLARPVDVLTRRSVEAHHNPWLKYDILRGSSVVYQAA